MSVVLDFGGRLAEPDEAAVDTIADSVFKELIASRSWAWTGPEGELAIRILCMHIFPSGYIPVLFAMPDPESRECQRVVFLTVASIRTWLQPGNEDVARYLADLVARLRGITPNAVRLFETFRAGVSGSIRTAASLSGAAEPSPHRASQVGRSSAAARGLQRNPSGGFGYRYGDFGLVARERPSHTRRHK